jgi:hypothetical protein
VSNRAALRDLLTALAVLTRTVLKDHVAGLNKSAKVIETVGTFYASMNCTVHVGVKNTELIIYDAVLTDGRKLPPNLVAGDRKVTHF